MMGTKPRDFGPISEITLNDLVPTDHFYRHLEQHLDLCFVRELVQNCYAAGGRPSIDPVVFFKLQLVMFFEGIRSERQLVTVAAYRLSVRWYLGYDLHERLPDHSSLTRIRERYGLLIFQRFFEHVLTLCQEAGLISASAIPAKNDRARRLTGARRRTLGTGSDRAQNICWHLRQIS